MSARSGCEAKKDIFLPEPATIIRTEQMTAQERFFELKLDSGRSLNHMPGQFVEVTVPGIGEAPFGISSSPTRGSNIELTVRNVGNVTNALHGLKAGQKVGIRGPLGKPWPVDSDMKGKDVLFIAGGIGLVPVRPAINYVFDKRKDYGKVTILFGAKTPGDRLFTDELQAWGARKDATFLETVDKCCDGWTGCVGVITTLFPKITIDPANTIIVMCGPPVMFKFAIMGLHDMKVPDKNIFISLERRMKCGVGKCGHCQVNGVYVCKDGPVFRYSDVVDLREAI